MNNLLKLKTDFKNSDILKYNYMDEMNQYHSILFDYIDLINDSNVDNINISKDGVIVSLKETGIKLHCIKNDRGIIPFAIIDFGEYEERLWDKTAELLDSPKTILDIGGNIGYFSLYFSKKFPNAKFHCFEPIPNNFKYLSKNLKLNKTTNINAYNIGLTDKKQTMEMFYNPEGCGSSSLKNLLEADCTKKVLCDFNTLDDFVSENNIGNIDFIKCDVEGAEKFVYEGGLNTLKEFKPVIFSEMLRKWSAKFNYHPNEIIELLNPIGYKCYAISKDTYRLIDYVTNDTIETNFIFKINEESVK